MASWLRILLALIVGAHGIGHLLFLVTVLDVADWGQSTRSWLLGDAWLAKGLGTVLWLVTITAFVAVAVGIFGERDWWRPLAIIAAVVSSLGLILFWASPTTSPAFSALVFNILVLGSLLIFRWPSPAQISGS